MCHLIAHSFGDKLRHQHALIFFLLHINLLLLFFQVSPSPGIPLSFSFVPGIIFLVFGVLIFFWVTVLMQYLLCGENQHSVQYILFTCDINACMI